MKRLGASAVVLFGLTVMVCASLPCAPLMAQRGGGGHGGFSGGGHAGFSGGGFRGSFSAGAGRSFASAPRGVAFAPRAGVRYAPGGAFGASAGRPVFYSNRRGRGYGAGYGRGYGYGGYGYGGAGYGYGTSIFLSPYELGYPDFLGYDASDDYSGPQNYVDQNYVDQGYVDQGYAPQPPDAGYPDPGYAGSGYVGPGYAYSGPQVPDNSQMAYAPPPSQPAAAAAPPEPEDAVTLIFKDGHTEQIHNYALTRTTLYVTGKRVHEVPLEELDLPATEKVNREAGVEFQLPTAK